jgi:curved DNA-binding protein CbpA
MTDYFALLNERRRPWIEPDTLKQMFFQLSAEVHPDRVHNAGEAEKLAAQQRYTELNAAYKCLREPRERLRHLLELEWGAKPGQVQAFPADLMDLSLAVGQLCREADAFLAEKARTTSPLLQVQMFERGQECAGRLLELQKLIQARHEEVTADVKMLDEHWEPGNGLAGPERAVRLGRLEEVYRRLSYLTRWSGQVQERVVQLAM